MAYSVFMLAAEEKYRNLGLTYDREPTTDETRYRKQVEGDEVIWDSVLKDNIFVVCRTPMAVSITKRTLAGFRDVTMNVKCYEKELPVMELVKKKIVKERVKANIKNPKTGEVEEKDIPNPLLTTKSVKGKKQYFYDGKPTKECELIDVLRYDPTIFEKDVVKGKDFWEVYNEIPKQPNENINNMKFTAIVGNPPYQIMDGGNNASASPVYNLFVDVARSIQPNFYSLIIPSRWTVGGRDLQSFRDTMLSDPHLAKIVDFQNPSDVFEGIRIGGGVCFLLWDNSKKEATLEIVNKQKGQHDVSAIRPSLEFGQEFMIRNNLLRNIVRKTMSSGNERVSSLSWTQKPFGFRTNFMGFRDEGEVKLYTKKNKQGFGFVNKNEIEKNADRINEWKVVTSRSTSVPEEDNGQVLRAVQTFISEPNSIVTESYVVVASFKEQKEAQNFLSYLKTKFFRILCQTLIVSPDVSAKTFSLVPLQDFTSNSDIDWSKSVEEIDQQLYKKYGLDEKEIEFIEKMIKPMN